MEDEHAQRNEHEQDARSGAENIYELEPEEPPTPAGPRVEPTGVPQPVVRDAPGAKMDRPDEPKPSAMFTAAHAPFTKGLGGMQATLIVLAVLTLLALVMTGVCAGEVRFSQLMFRLAHTLLAIAVNGALGSLAVVAAARCVGTRVADPELFALRMLAAAASFQLLFQTGTPIPGTIDDRILGVAAYATTIWLLFRLPPKETGLVVAWHAGLIALLWCEAIVARQIVILPKSVAQPHSDVGPAPIGGN